MLKLRGLVTGIGSLPHTDVEAALDLIFKYCPQVPFWPQLPKKNLQEGMYAQFSENFPCLVFDGKSLSYDPVDKEKKLEIFYEKIIAQDLGYFAISRDYASGIYAFKKRLLDNSALLKGIEFIKCHITGSFTLAAGLKDEKGIALLHDSVFMQVIIKGLVMKALWQIKFFEEFGKKIIVFIDEPYLSCFGSAYTPLNKENVVKGLIELVEGIKPPGSLIGVHCCGNTDWSIFTDVPGIDILNFDAFGYLEKFVLYADNLKGFISKGGMICWGIAPTEEFSSQLNPDLLVAKINEGIEGLSKKGVDRGLLLNSLLVSPACGLGTLDTARAEKIFELLFGVKNKLFDKIG